MADLDEIMAGRSDSAPVDQQQTQPAAAPQIEGQPQVHESEGEGERNPLQPALDAERGKSRKYKEELADVNRRFGEFQQQFTGFMQAFQAQQRPQQQAPQEVPQFWDNPEAAIDHRLSQTMQGQIDPIRQAMMFNSRLTAEAIHQADVVQAAEQAFNAAAAAGQIDPREHARINSSPNPFHEAVLWHKRSTALAEVGTDPSAYRERLRAELLAELQAGQGQQQAAPQQHPGSAPAQTMPTSFAGARNAGPRSQPQWTGPKPLSEIMPR